MVDKAQGNILAVLSGGMDSVIAMRVVTQTFKSPRIGAIHFEYGQRSNVAERAAFDRLCEYYSIAYRQVVVLPILHRSALTRGAPLAIQNVPLTYVPNRNMIIIAVAGSYALQYDFESVVVGIHSQDAPYPDCTRRFARLADQTLHEATAGLLRLQSPLIALSKAKIVAVGLKLEVPFELTWSCYTPRGKEGDHFIACGTCGACRMRLKAFAANETPDPIRYVERM